MKVVAALLVACTVLLTVNLGTPAEASCTVPALIGTTAADGSSFIWTANVFDPQYYPGYPPLSYGADAGPPVTPNFAGSFWKLGSGDVSPGMGDDNGTYDFVAAGGFYYAVYPAYGPYYGYYSSGSIFASWFTPGVDGCILGDNCLCMLLTDQDGATGYFAMVSARSLPTNDTFLNQGGSDGAGNDAPIILLPIPRPAITGSSTTSASPPGLEFTVVVDPPGGGVYAQDGCDCGPVGYKIYQQVVPRGTLPPDDRLIILWSSIVPDQPTRPLGSPATFPVTCEEDQDIYVAASLIFDSSYETPVLSSNATRIECGFTLADPDDRPRPDPTRIRPTAPSPRRRGGRR